MVPPIVLLEVELFSLTPTHPQSMRGYNWTIVSPVRPVISIPDSILENNARFQNSHTDHDPGELVVSVNDSRR